MPEVSHTFTIDIPCQEAWEKLRDLTLAHNYIPAVHDVKIHTDEVEGVGVHRTVYLKRSPGEMDETVEEWVEGQTVLLRLHKGDKPIAPIFAENQFRYTIEPDGERTRATVTMSYEPSGVMGKLLGALVLGRAFRKELTAIGVNMKAFYETGVSQWDAA